MSVGSEHLSEHRVVPAQVQDFTSGSGEFYAVLAGPFLHLAAVPLGGTHVLQCIICSPQEAMLKMAAHLFEKGQVFNIQGRRCCLSM